MELERLVKSALRIDNMDVATRIADSAAELNRQQDLVALVALRSKTLNGLPPPGNHSGLGKWTASNQIPI